jgi:hypothetical protein
MGRVAGDDVLADGQLFTLKHNFPVGNTENLIY